jgi:NTE family protein
VRDAPCRRPGAAGRRTAFVLGGGGLLGAAEVGMLRALFEHGIRPDLIVGTSVGAINGALVAADPTPSAVDRLRRVWEELASAGIFAGSLLARMGPCVRTGTHLHPREPLRDLLAAHLPVQTFAELAVPFQCVAASIERAPSTGSPRAAHRGGARVLRRPRAAAPGRDRRRALPGRRTGLQHPGRPGGRARADTIYVLHVGRSIARSRPPDGRGRSPWSPSRSRGGIGSPPTWPR